MNYHHYWKVSSLHQGQNVCKHCKVVVKHTARRKCNMVVHTRISPVYSFQSSINIFGGFYITWNHFVSSGQRPHINQYKLDRCEGQHKLWHPGITIYTGGLSIIHKHQHLILITLTSVPLTVLTHPHTANITTKQAFIDSDIPLKSMNQFKTATKTTFTKQPYIVE